MVNVIHKIQKMMNNDLAYVNSGHVFCYANSSPTHTHEFDVPSYLKRNYQDALLWYPHTHLGLKEHLCTASPWGSGCPTINAHRLDV